MKSHLPGGGRSFYMAFISYKKGFKYQLFKDVEVETLVRLGTFDVSCEFLNLNRDGKLTIKRGYAWDGASGPTIDTEASMAAALVHDGLYQLMRMGLIEEKWRTVADGELKRIFLDSGLNMIRVRTRHRMPTAPELSDLLYESEIAVKSWLHTIRVWVWFVAVQTFAAPAAKNGNERPVLEAKYYL